MSETPPIPAPDPVRVPGPNAYRYKGTGSRNNDSILPYAEEEMNAIKADVVEILAHGYTVDRAVRLMGHWATSPEKHKGIDGVEYEGPHPSFGRAVPARKTLYVWRDKDPDFAEAWDEAFNVRGTEHLEDFGLDMAYAGDSKMVMFILKARNPAKYANFGALAGSGFQILISQQDEQL